MKTNARIRILSIPVTCFFCLLAGSANAQNTFPATGRAGIYTTAPAASLQVKGGARIGNTANYVNIDSATGNLSFAGTSGYSVAGNKYAFQYSGNTNYGLFFNSTSVQYEFRNGSAVPVFTVNANTGNSVFNGTLKVGAYTLPVTDGSNGQLLKTNGAGVLTWSNDNSGSGSGWSLTGNSGTSPSTNFIGTTDGQPLIFKVNNIRAGFINNSTYNTSFGYQALISGTTGNFNTANGYASLQNNASGVSNTAAGYYSLFSNTSGNSNTATGTLSLAANTIGSENTAIGIGSLNANNASDNTAAGAYSLTVNTSGALNSATGAYSLYSNTTGSNNVANGGNALYSNTEGNFNTAGGAFANYRNTTGVENTSYGYSSLYKNTTGNYNVAIGSNALYSNTNAEYNIGIGAYALYSNNSSGDNNIAIGNRALYSAAGGGILNVAIGGLALYNATGFLNINNVAVGYQSLYQNTQGYQNTAVGRNALYTNTTGTDNTALGNFADVGSANLSNATAIGADAIVNATNKVVIGSNTAGMVIGGYAPWSNLSDGRFKENVKEDVPGLKFINKLHPVTYTINTKKLDEHIMQNMPDSIRAKRMQSAESYAKATTKIQTGLIAQDVEKAAKDLGYSFDGVNAPQNSTDNYSVAYSQFIMPLIKAVQELSKINDAKDARIDTLQKQNSDLQKQFNDLKTQVLSIQQKQESCSPCSGAVSAQSQSYSTTLSDASVLLQNIPNPFTQQQ